MSDSASHGLHEAKVIEVHDITPRMRRVVVAGEGLRRLSIDQPAMWMKLFFPWPSGVRPPGRAYTIRAWHAARGMMTFDFALHGHHGPAAWWIARVRKGDTLQMAGPRAGHRLDPGVRRHLLIGDATALPAIAGILEALPAQARAEVFVEVAGAAEEQPLACAGKVTVRWIHAATAAPGTSGRLELAVQQADLPGTCQVFLAGEAVMVRALRTHLLIDRGVPKPLVDAKGYWRAGDADYRET